MIIQEVGRWAGTISTIIMAFQLVPQVLHSFRTKNTEGVSLVFLIMGLCGSSLRLFYCVTILKSSDAFTIGINNFLAIIALSLIIYAKSQWDTDKSMKKNGNLEYTTLQSDMSI